MSLLILCLRPKTPNMSRLKVTSLSFYIMLLSALLSSLPRDLREHLHRFHTSAKPTDSPCMTLSLLHFTFVFVIMSTFLLFHGMS